MLDNICNFSINKTLSDKPYFNKLDTTIISYTKLNKYRVNRIHKYINMWIQYNVVSRIFI